MNRPVPDQVILGLLQAHPAHGYELLEIFHTHAQLGRIWSISTSQLYAVLKRLATQGAIAGREVDVHNAPARIEYEITDFGAQQLKNWLIEPNPSASIHRIRVMFLSRIFIARLLGLEADAIVNAQIKSCQKMKNRFLAQRGLTRSEIEVLTLDFVINQMDTAITWLRQNEFNLERVVLNQ
jgi:DNA-binding PadR family transcriptional regulator